MKANGKFLKKLVGGRIHVVFTSTSTHHTTVKREGFFKPAVVGQYSTDDEGVYKLNKIANGGIILEKYDDHFADIRIKNCKVVENDLIDARKNLKKRGLDFAAVVKSHDGYPEWETIKLEPRKLFGLIPYTPTKDVKVGCECTYQYAYGISFFVPLSAIKTIEVADVDDDIEGLDDNDLIELLEKPEKAKAAIKKFCSWTVGSKLTAKEMGWRS